MPDVTPWSTDLLNNVFSPEEAKLFAIYLAVKELNATDLAPCVSANVKVALAALGVAVADLGLAYEHLTDDGC